MKRLVPNDTAKETTSPASKETGLVSVRPRSIDDRHAARLARVGGSCRLVVGIVTRGRRNRVTRGARGSFRLTLGGILGKIGRRTCGDRSSVAAAATTVAASASATVTTSTSVIAATAGADFTAARVRGMAASLAVMGSAMGPTSTTSAAMASFGEIAKTQDGHQGHKDGKDTRSFHRSLLRFSRKVKLRVHPITGAPEP